MKPHQWRTQTAPDGQLFLVVWFPVERDTQRFKITTYDGSEKIDYSLQFSDFAVLTDVQANRRQNNE